MSKIQPNENKNAFIPLPMRNEAKQYYEEHGFLDEWTKYANVMKNAFMRKMLMIRQQNICPYCGNRLTENMHPQLHHKTYMHLCFCDNSSYFDKGNIPDCERCFYEHHDRFTECMANLAYIHQGCHFEIHQEYIEQKKEEF